MKQFAPYIDITLPDPLTLLDIYKATKNKLFTLAFVNLDSWGSGAPCWGGYPSYAISTDKKSFKADQINDLRKEGGDVIVSFGGANGQHEPAIDIQI